MVWGWYKHDHWFNGFYAISWMLKWENFFWLTVVECFKCWFKSGLKKYLKMLLVMITVCFHTGSRVFLFNNFIMYCRHPPDRDWVPQKTSLWRGWESQVKLIFIFLNHDTKCIQIYLYNLSLATRSTSWHWQPKSVLKIPHTGDTNSWPIKIVSPIP